MLRIRACPICGKQYHYKCAACDCGYQFSDSDPVYFFDDPLPEPGEAQEPLRPEPEPKRRSCPSFDKVGYQLSIFVLACLLLVSFLSFTSARSALSDAEDTVEELEHEARDAYDAGQEAGRSEGFDEGYAAGVGDYAPEVSFFRQNACIVTVSGRKYHHWGCHHIAGSRYYIYNIELAQSYGYEPCEDCWDDGLLVDWNG